MSDNSKNESGFASGLFEQLNNFAKGAQIFKVRGQPGFASAAFAERRGFDNPEQKDNSKASFLTFLRRRSKSIFQYHVSKLIIKKMRVGDFPKRLSHTAYGSALKFNSFITKITEISKEDRGFLSKFDEQLALEMFERGYFSAPVKLGTVNPSKRSANVPISGRPAAILISTLSNGLPKEQVVSQFSGNQNIALTRAMVLFHELSHSHLQQIKNPFKPTPGVISEEAVDFLNKTHFDFRYVNAVFQNYDPYRVLHECFADTYGSMLLLEASGHSQSAQDLVRDVEIKRQKDKESQERAWVNHIEATDVKYAGSFGSAYPTDSALNKLLKSREAWRGLPPEQLQQISLTIASDAVLEWADPNRLLDGKPVGALNRLALSSFNVSLPKVMISLGEEFISGGDTAAFVDQFDGAPGAAFLAKCEQETISLVKRMLPSDFPEGQDERFEKLMNGSLPYPNIFNLTDYENIVALVKDDGAVVRDYIQWRAALEKTTSGLAASLSEEAIEVLRSENWKFRNDATLFTNSLKQKHSSMVYEFDQFIQRGHVTRQDIEMLTVSESNISSNKFVRPSLEKLLSERNTMSQKNNPGSTGP